MCSLPVEAFKQKLDDCWNAKEIPALDKIFFKTPFNSRSQKLVSEQKKSHTYKTDTGSG